MSGSATSFSRKICPNGERGLNEVQEKINKNVKQLMVKYRDIFWDFSSEDDVIDDSISTDSEVTFVRNEQSMMKASAWYYCSYKEQNIDHSPLYSFPWVAFDELCRIKSSRSK